MNEITRIALENEMDIILAHRQSMKLLELTGVSLPAQTSFATAVSEIARVALDSGKEACLILSVSGKREKHKVITAIIKDDKAEFITSGSAGFKYARKLVSDISLSKDTSGHTQVEINHQIPVPFRVDDELIQKWIILFNTDPAVSPYEEIKRKNKQLSELSEKLKASEGEYRILTNSLPLMIFTLNQDLKVTYANQWMRTYTGQTVETLNETAWKDVLHPEDPTDIWEWQKDEQYGYRPVTIERRLKNIHTGEYKWYTGIATPILDIEGALQYWTVYLADIHAQKTVEQTLKDNKELKETQAKLEQNIEELNRSNQELEQFAYVASHDLQEPLRKIAFYSDYLVKKYGNQLNEEGAGFVKNIMRATDRMKLLIHDILAYSTINKEKKPFSKVDLNLVAQEAIQDLEIAINEKNAQLHIDPLPSVKGDENQLKQLFENILSNSVKYTLPNTPPQIHISAEVADNMAVLYFKDEGIGFEEKYAERMFALFQRLHGKSTYIGTGIGLAICKKIVEIHHGEITAKSEPGKGATFIVKLPLK